MTTLTAIPLLSQIIQRLQTLQDKLVHIDLPSRAYAVRRARSGFVSLVGAGPGSADLITLRGLQRIKTADVIYYDRLADPALLLHAHPKARQISVGKAPGCHSKSQPEINALLVQSAQAGEQVVRLKCGDPGIFARGAEEADALTAAGIAWEIIPGVTSACAAAASAGSFLTERGQTDRLILATGHLREGGVQDWAASAQPGTTLACYMGVSQAANITNGLLQAGWPSGSPVQVISKAQTLAEQIFDCRLDTLVALCAQHEGLNPAILLIRWPLLVAKEAAADEGAAFEAGLHLDGV